jgi:tripartite-type tricarboxylate transporter receptor subunit TctC
MARIASACFLTLIALILGTGGVALGQDYPNRTVRIIVPFGAGGPADIYARAVAEALLERFKQSFVVENRPGAGSLIGTGEAAKSPPDGYTLLMMSNTHTVNETLLPNRPFRLMRDFVAVAPVNFSDLVVVLHPTVPANDTREFIALLKAKPNEFNYASSGPGTPYHMAGELFKALTDTGIVHVPHRGSGEARSSVIGGHVQMMIDAVTTMAPAVREGQVKALGTTGLKRSSVLPDVPTIAESGVPGYEALIWLGLMAPAGSPPDVVATLNTAIGEFVARPQTQTAWRSQGAEPLRMSPSEFDAYIRKDIEKWADLITKADIRVQK